MNIIRNNSLICRLDDCKVIIDSYKEPFLWIYHLIPVPQLMLSSNVIAVP